MTLSPAILTSWVAQLLEASGLSPVHAAAAADVYRRASVRGLGHHDLSYLPQRLQWLANGEVNAQPRLELVSEAPSVEVWDGDEGLGEVLCRHITLRALERARSNGVAYSAVRRSNHFLAADPYVQIGREAGALVIVWSNSDAGMAFPGQKTKTLGNNPLGWGVGSGEASLSADLCLAESSIGNLNALAAQGRSAPEHWGLGPDGKPTTDPNELLRGAVGPIGGPKGLALALLGEVLTGILADGTTLDQVVPPSGLRTHNQMVLAFDLSWFGGVSAVGERIASLRRRALDAGKVERLPGDRSRQAQENAEHSGIELPPELVLRLGDWSARLSVPVPV